jgi:hypothetical protein
LPASIYLQSLPPILPADNKSYNSLVVSLLDTSGNPSLAVAPIEVNLRSSQLNVASVNLSVTIQPNHDYVIATMTTTDIPGTTQVTATSPNLLPAIIPVSTATPSGLASTLKVYPIPAQIVPGGSGLIAVELLDATGLPAKSATDVTVQLSVTVTNVVTLSSNILTISAGTFFAELGYTATRTIGASTTVSAFSAGYITGQGAVKVVPVGGAGTKIVLQGIFQTGIGSASIMPADGQAYNALQVTFVDSANNPVPAPGAGILVQLSSSKNSIIGVQPAVTIPGGANSIMTSLSMGIQQGFSNITAFSTGLLGSSVIVSAIIPAPSRLAVYVDPSTKILSPLTNPLLVVQLQDAGGSPARAKESTSVLVSSTNQSVVQGGFTLNMSTGDDFASAFLTTPHTGFTLLTASSSGLVSAANLPIVIVQLPLVVSLYSSSYSITLNASATISLSASLLGQPLTGANVTWFASQGTVSQASSVTSPQGATSVLFRPIAVGEGNITALVSYPAVGVTKESVFLQIKPVPLPQPLTLLQIIMKYWYFILLPLAVIAVYLSLYVRRRRRRAREELEAAFQNVS